MDRRGWIALPGGDHEGLWAVDEPYTVHWDKAAAERDREALRDRLVNNPELVEVEVCN